MLQHHLYVLFCNILEHDIKLIVAQCLRQNANVLLACMRLCLVVCNVSKISRESPTEDLYS